MDKPDQPTSAHPVISRKLPRAVVLLGLVSFFNDFASDIVIPLIPILLATVLAAGPIALGLIEGVADALACFLKLWAGRHSDRMSGRRKGLALTGYTLSNLARPLLGLAGSWGTVLVLRSIDRVGKGLRSAPRDAMVADVTPPHIRGYAFGFHRALDNAGAVAGALAAAAVLAWSDLSLSEVILWSAIPGFVAVMLLGVGVKEEEKNSHIQSAELQRTLPPLRWSALSVPMKHYLWVLMLFTFARASETFILLFGHQLGISVVELLLLWAVLNLAKAITSTQGGRLADHSGRGALILIGWSALAVSFLTLSQVTTSIGLWMVSVFYGLLMGMSEGAERALISDYALANERGTAFGWYHLVCGVAAIPAGLLFGVIWHVFGAAAAFLFAGLLALLATILLRLWLGPCGVTITNKDEQIMMEWLTIVLSTFALGFMFWFFSRNRKTLQLGQPAPDFKLVDQHGNIHTLADFQGKWLALYFYPKDDTPGCTKQACAFRDGFQELTTLGAEVIGVSVDGANSHADFSRKHHLPFPLLADITTETAARYHSLINLGIIKFAKRNTFLIDPQGKIARMYLSASAARNSAEVIGDLKSLQAV